jgi:hypothetical protein
MPAGAETLLIAFEDEYSGSRTRKIVSEANLGINDDQHLIMNSHTADGYHQKMWLKTVRVQDSDANEVDIFVDILVARPGGAVMMATVTQRLRYGEPSVVVGRYDKLHGEYKLQFLLSLKDMEFNENGDVVERP